MLNKFKMHFASESDELRFWQSQKVKGDAAKTSPETVVLRPVKLVLNWLSHIKPAPEAEPKIHIPQPKLARNLQESAMGRSLFIGTVFCFVYLIFYAVTAAEVWHLLHEGECVANELSCTAAMMRKVAGLLAMGCYVITMGVVITKIDRVDQVMEATQELKAMEDFKHEIDQLNAHAFATTAGSDGAPRLSMLTDIADSLEATQGIINDFFIETHSAITPVEKYEELLHKLENVHESVNPTPRTEETAEKSELKPLVGDSAGEP